MPAVWWVGMKMRTLMFPISWIVQARVAEVATLVEENITGVRIVKSFAAELQQIKALANSARRVQWAQTKQIDVRATYAPVLQALPQLGLVGVLFYSGYLVMSGQLDMGAIPLFSSYIVFLTMPFRMLGFMLMLNARARASAQRIYEMRRKAGLTQRQLASLIGTSASAISRLESADYDSHSLTMLQKISTALRHRIRVQFLPVGATTRRKVPA